MYKVGGNEMVSCPYNRSHLVSKLRIQKHIIKCQDRHPEIKLVTCFYNYTHKMRPEDVLDHYEICSERVRIEEAQYGKGKCIPWTLSEDQEKSILGHSQKPHSIKSCTEDSGPKTSASQKESQNLTGKDDDWEDWDDLRPLNLPKTVSKAFTGVKPLLTKKSSNLVPASESDLSSSVGLGRGKPSFQKPPKSRTGDYLQQDVGVMKKRCPKKKKSKSKYFLKVVSDPGNNCNASVISSTFDDGTTWKSDDITFYNEDEDDATDSFIAKNFDKYIRI